MVGVMDWLKIALMTAGLTLVIMLAATTGIVIMLKILEKMNLW